MEKRKNIGLFLDTFFPMVDGVVSVVDNYARLLSEKANVTVFTIKTKKKFDDSKLPYKVVRCKSFRVLNLDYSLGTPQYDKQFRKAVKESNLDIVHIHSPFSIGGTGLRYAKKNNIPVVASLHSQFKKDFYRASKSKVITAMLLKNIMGVFNKCDEAWAVNGEVAKVFKEYGIKIKTSVVNNATDMEYLPEVDKQILDKYGVDPNKNNFLFVGRLNALKNIFFIVDVMEVLKNKGYDFVMNFVGFGQDAEKLKKYIEGKNLTDCVKVLGQIKDRKELATMYKVSKLFVFPSLYDCSSIVQIEASSQKTPAIFIKGAVTAENVVDNENGYLEIEDKEAFANKIMQIFANEQEYNRVCENCYDTLYVNWEKRIDQVYQRYLELINWKLENSEKDKQEKQSGKIHFKKRKNSKKIQ